MKIFFKPSFIKDFSRLSKETRKEIHKLCVVEFSEAHNLRSLKNIDIKTLKGFKNYHRIRIGNYRIGFKLEDKAVIFMRVLHRKEIYRYFP